MILRDLLDVINTERRRKERIKAVQNIAVGIGIVTAVGVVTGVLSAPKSGRETRQEMKLKAVNTIETIKDVIKDIYIKAEHLKEDTKEENISNEIIKSVK